MGRSIEFTDRQTGWNLMTCRTQRFTPLFKLL